MEIFPVDLDKYKVSVKFGFIVENPLETLPKYFEPWNVLAKQSAELVLSHKHRDAVQKLPLLDHKKLQGHREKRLAHLQLSLITACYVWQEGHDAPAKVLPKTIAVPFCGVSEDLGIVPVLSHCSYVLANSKWNPDTRSFQCLYSFPGGVDSDNFITTVADVEFAFAAGMKNLLDALYNAEQGNTYQLTECLNEMCNTAANLKQAFVQIHEKVRPTAFFNRIRPFLFGWGGKTSPLPEGLIYEGVHKEPQQLCSQNATQSCAFPCFDAALGVNYKPDVKSKLERSHSHVLPRHRELVKLIREHSRIKQLVEEAKCDALRAAYNKCLQTLADFRTYHITVFTKYQIVMAHKQPPGNTEETERRKNENTISMTHLKEMRTTTLEAKLNENKTSS